MPKISTTQNPKIYATYYSFLNRLSANRTSLHTLLATCHLNTPWQWSFR